MPRRIILPAIAALAIFGGYTILAQGKAPPPALGTAPVVVELFTSQGCSSCPPADALIARLAREPGIIAISRPVTYWDRLGWRDTLAQESNTALQRAYVARGVGGEAFTPQVVVQGQGSAIGSDERAIRSLIANASRSQHLSIAATASERGGRAIAIGGAAGKAADVKLITLRRSVPVRIGSGENGGRQIAYTNVVAREAVLGTWRGGAQQFALPASRTAAPGEAAAVIVQQRGNGPIIGALLLP